jgi:hypothetical protein
MIADAHAETPEFVGGTVWILGAGFSRPLGGPLISDLLAYREQVVLDGFFPRSYANRDQLVKDNFRARGFFHYGRERGYWEHAEQFLDVVETANDEDGSQPSSARQLLESLLKGVAQYPSRDIMRGGASWEWREIPGPVHDFESLAALSQACRRALATDVSVFLRVAQAESERWAPHLAWSRNQIDQNHTIITFNYDCVPEKLAQAGGKLAVVDPLSVQRSMRDARAAGFAPVFKLHGSVSWFNDGARPVTDKGYETALEQLGQREVLISWPGPHKRGFYEADLKDLKSEALDELRHARRVVFVGYRFPPTDADARYFLLDAIRKNDKALEVFVVLGPDTKSPDALRLDRMISAARHSSISPALLPLWAEDFLSLYGNGVSLEELASP